MYNMYLFYIPNPVLDVVKRLLIGNVIHQHDALEKKRHRKLSVSCDFSVVHVGPYD